MGFLSNFSFGIVIEALLVLQLSTGSVNAQTKVDVLSYHGGSVVSNGVNASEFEITPSGFSTFQKNFSTSITDVPNLTGLPSSTLPSGIDYTDPAGAVYAEPLVKTGVTITTGKYQGVHDVVFVATSMDSLYAIDATGGTILWKDSFLYNASGNPNPLNATIPAGVTAVPGGYGTETNSQDVSPWIGIVSTPVIDGVNGYIYLVAKTREARGNETNPHYVYTLHKVSLANGLDTNTVIADTTLNTSNTTFTFNSSPYVLGTGEDSVVVNGQKRIYFNAVRQMVRPALQLYGGRIYIAAASHGDNQPYHGWLFTYDAASLVCNGAWNSTPNGSEGGIWQGGGSVVIDQNGYIYFQTGNGSFDGQNTGNVVTGLDANGFPSSGDYGDCFVKLALDPTTTQGNQGTNKNGWGLVVVDYFAPYNDQALSAGDTDIGSGGPTILPDSAGSAAHPHLLIGAGKAGTLYLVDRDNMGKFGITDNVVQSFSGAINASFSVPSYFNGRLYASAGFGGTVESWPLAGATLTVGGDQNSPDQIAFPGCSPYISANGSVSGVVWVVDKGTGQLRAYDATNLATELWTSNLNATRDALGSAVKFSVPTPVNGNVYVGTADHLVVYGGAGIPTAAPAAPSSLTVTAVAPSTVTLSWTDNSNNEAGFAIERSSNDVTFSQVGTVGVNQTTYEDSGLSSQAEYYYRVRAFNSYNSLSYSNYTNIVSATTTSLNSESPVHLYHFDEGSGTATVDSVGGNNGTLIGSPTPAWVSPGRIGSSNLSFTGNGEYSQTNESAVQVKSDLSPTLGTTSSLLFWIKTVQVGSNTHWEAPAVTGADEVAGTNDIDWGYIDASGHIGVAVGDSGSVMSVNPVNDGLWHHIALTRNAVSGVVQVYVDGALSNSGNLITGNETTPFKLIGALSDVQSNDTTFAGANFFAGQLDDVQLYNIVVDPAVIAAIALPPAAPTNLAVTVASGTELDLSWTNNATNDTGYNVWSSANGGAWTEIAQLPANTAAYMDVGLNQGTTYAYYVQAVNSVGSSVSNTVTATTPVPPLTPSNAVVTYLSPTAIDLQWTNNATNDTGYRILRNSNNGAFSQIASLAPNSTFYQDLTVQPGINYDYHIQAYNLAGYSDFAGLTITTPAASQYLTYLASYGLTSTAQTNPLADPSEDGVPNLLEYAFAMNPVVPGVAGLPVVTVQNGCLTITFTELIPPVDVIYTVQVSSDLVTWNSGPGYTTQVSVTPINSTTQQVVVRDNTPLTSANKRFIRVSVSH